MGAARPPLLPAGAALLSLVLAATAARGEAVTTGPAPDPAVLGQVLKAPPDGRGCAIASRLRIIDGRAAAAPILGRIEGFAKVAGVTGGLGKRVLWVTSTRDIDPRTRASPPAGTLRWAVEEARRSGGGWIVLDRRLGPRPRIDLLAPLRVPADTTIDGGCSGVTLTARPDDAILLVVARAHNVVLTGLRLEKRGTTTPESAGDCITVGQEADGVWIAYNSLSRCGDGMIDITQSGPSDRATRVTVAYNRFADHDKAMIAATLDCQSAGRHPDWCTAPLGRAWSWSDGVQVTLQGNVFAGTGQRHPRLAGRAYVHVVDGVVAPRPFTRSAGDVGASYGALAATGGRLLVEHTLFAPLASPGRTDAVRSQSGAGDGPGAVRLSVVMVLGGGRAAESDPQLVPPPPYTIAPARSYTRDPLAEAACAAHLAGPAAASAPRTCQRDRPDRPTPP